MTLAAARWMRRRGWQQGAWLLGLMTTLGLGLVRYSLAQPNLADPHFVAAYRDIGPPVRLVGVVLDDPPRMDGRMARFRLRAERLRLGEEARALAVYGVVLVRAPVEAARDLRYGDRIVVRGQLRTPPAGRTFDYRAYLARQGVYAQLTATRLGVLAHHQGNPWLAALAALRRRALGLIARLWPDPEAALLQGILLGDDQRLPPALYRAFRDTGTAHIIAISGFNITVLAGVTLALSSRLLGWGWGTLFAVVVIAAYTALVGGDPAVTRAAWMGGLALFARRLGRGTHPYTALAVAAALMTLWRPTVLWDVGFQLSFAATWGLMRYAEPLRRLAARGLRPWLGPWTERVLPWLEEAVLLTLAAQFTTFPVVAYHFHRVSLVAPLVNLLVLPVQTVLMFSGGAVVLIGLVSEPLARLLAWIAWPWPAYTIRVVQHLGTGPWAALTLGDFTWVHGVIYWALLMVSPHFWNRWQRAWYRWGVPALRGVPGLALSVVGAAWLARSALSAPDGRLHLWLFPSSGPVMLVRTPSGNTVLLGQVEDGTEVVQALGRWLPPTEGMSAWVMASGADPGLGWLDLLPRYAPRAVFHPPLGAVTSPAARRLWAVLAASGISRQVVSDAASLSLDRQVSLEVLAATPSGLVLRLRYGAFVALLPLGRPPLEPTAPWREAARHPPPTVLLLAQEGRLAANPPQWVQTLRPRLLLLSGEQTMLARSDLALLQALQAYSWLRTDLYGTVHLTTDGRMLWAAVEQPGP